MSRYCFYCGRSLETGEKCRCRERTRAAATAYDGTASEPFERQASPSSRETSDRQTATETGDRQAASSTESAEAIRKEAKRRARDARRNQRRARRDAARQTAGSGGYRRFGWADFFRLFVAPADAIRLFTAPLWTTRHTLVFILTSLLGGLHYLNIGRVSMPLRRVPVITGDTALRFLTGVTCSAVFILIYALVVWALARFVYRQRALPFTHALSAGFISWLYMCVFLVIGYPVSLQGGSYGMIVTVMGLAFACFIHARSLGLLTHLNDNQTLNLTLLSIFFFATLLSVAFAFLQAFVRF